MGLSLIALCGAIALLLGSIPRLNWPVALTGGAAAGLFPPVIGSLYFGQANLLVLLALTIAYGCVAPGPMLGLASAIKLYPISGFLAAITERPPRWRRLAIGLAVLGVLLLLQLGAGGAKLEEQQDTEYGEADRKPAPARRALGDGGQEAADRVQLDGAGEPEHGPGSDASIGDRQRQQHQQVGLAEVERADHWREKPGGGSAGKRDGPVQTRDRPEQQRDRAAKRDQA